MKKNSKKVANEKKQSEERLTVGIDLGDRTSHYSVQNALGEEIESGKVPTTREGLTRHFGDVRRRRFVVEAGTHSNWVRTRLEEMGHEVIVASPRHIPGITKSARKSDPHDAEKLAMYARVDTRILHPIQHRRLETQYDAAVLRSREGLVGARTKLINVARGLTKCVGDRLPKCGAEQFTARAQEGLPEELKPCLGPLLKAIEELDRRIEELSETAKKLAEEKYAEATKRLRQVWGVGTLTSLCFVLTLEDSERVAKSRSAGAVMGLVPKHRQSGGSDPQLGISKEGHTKARWYLVECAHRIVSERAPDSDLRRFGRKLCERGGKNAKKRALVAVARKLAVLLHKLWKSGDRYDPLYNSKRSQTTVAA